MTDDKLGDEAAARLDGDQPDDSACITLPVAELEEWFEQLEYLHEDRAQRMLHYGNLADKIAKLMPK